MALRILFVSHTDVFGAFRVGSHHYARELAKAGNDVVHLSTPLSLAHTITRRISPERRRAIPRGVHTDDFGVRHVVPRSVLPAGVGYIDWIALLRGLRLPTDFDVVFLDQPLLWNSSLRQVARTLIYRPTDEYPAGVKARLQADILTKADGVIATSGRVLEALGEIETPSVVHVNGVEVERFEGTTDSTMRDRTCVYVGALDHRFDQMQVEQWASEFPDWRFEIAGPPLSGWKPSSSNIVTPGTQPYERLPKLFRSARIGLLPLSDSPLNAGRSPMKLYEYLAAGLSVVAKRTAVIHPNDEIGVFTYENSAQARESLASAMRFPVPNTRGVTAAREQSWTTKAKCVLEFAQAIGKQ
ncbi:glycosyltransferase family protein [Microbacterium abyssi]|uniref:glycosyltransferase family protein n=1 Tax=Microbacterium abyssi TaxID=2782166 RepID=UPI001887B67A|nr:glycosyltransferase [Microbacterium sp. A18JL241]